MSFAVLKNDAHDFVQNGREETGFERSRWKAINNWKRYEVAIKTEKHIITHPVVFKYCFILSGHSDLCLSGNAVKPAAAIYNCSSSFSVVSEHVSVRPKTTQPWKNFGGNCQIFFLGGYIIEQLWRKEFVLNLFLVDIAEMEHVSVLPLPYHFHHHYQQVSPKI